MKQITKKLGLFVLVALLGLSQVQAASLTVVIPPNGRTTNILAAPLLVTQVLLTSNGTNTTILAVDGVNTNLTASIAAYTNYSQYASNVINSWTNFFGVTNTVTNLSLVTTTNTVASSTLTYPTRFQVSAAGGTNTTILNGSYMFLSGFMLTNNSTGIATVTLDYQQ